MSTNDLSAQVRPIPALLTNSARVLLDTFGDHIIQLVAKGSTELRNRSPLQDLREYGAAREQRTLHRITLDYEQLPGADGPANPLTDDAKQDIFDALDRHLDTEDLSVAPDLAVTALTLRVTEPQLKDVTPAQTAKFDLHFVADPADDPLRERTRRLNQDRGLYDELGFELTHLNLRSVVETATKYHEQGDGRYLSWQGPGDVRIKTSRTLASRINQHILPDTYGLIKPYIVDDNKVLEINEDELDADVADPYGGDRQ